MSNLLDYENKYYDLGYDYIIGLDEVMPSGSSAESSKSLGFDKESIKNKIKELLKK